MRRHTGNTSSPTPRGASCLRPTAPTLTDEQVKAYLEGHFVLIEYTQLPRIDSDGAALDEEGLSAVDRIAERALDELARLRRGRRFCRGVRRGGGRQL